MRKKTVVLLLVLAAILGTAAVAIAALRVPANVAPEVVDCGCLDNALSDVG